MDAPFIQNLESSKGCEEALIIVRGYRCEESFRGRIREDWVRSIREADWKGSIHYLWWDASDPAFINNMRSIHRWKKTKDRAERVGKIYFEPLTDSLPSQSISLIGHSLGVRVIFYAVKMWASSKKKINNAVLLGGAVRKNKDWQQVSCNLNGYVFNLYNPKDPVLKTEYRIGEFLVAPNLCGLEPIQENLKTKNINVTNYVENSHSEDDYLYAVRKIGQELWKGTSNYANNL